MNNAEENYLGLIEILEAIKCSATLHLMKKAPALKFGECGVHHHYHYSQVHFDLEW